MQVGDRCRIGQQNRQGCIAYIGQVSDLPSGEWIGVRLDRPTGRNSGSVNGTQYFDCDENCGVFVRPEKITTIFSTAKVVSTPPAEKDSNENVDLFWKDLNAKVSEIEVLCTRAIDLKNAVETTSQAAIDLINKEIPHEIALLNEAVARAASVYLPKYDVRQSQTVMANLEQKMQQTKDQVVPRKKFSFRTRKVPSAPTPVVQQQQQDQEVGSAVVDVHESHAMSFTDRTDELIIIEKEEDHSPDIVLSNLSNCTICILIETYAIRGAQLDNCTVYSGPVAGSILLHHCTDCEFHVITRQLRIHDTLRTNFYLSIGSNPIIEDCDGLGFAPYSLSYPKLQMQLTTANMVFNNELWQQVNDFKWHRVQHSPHWRLIPVNERTTKVKGNDYVNIKNESWVDP